MDADYLFDNFNDIIKITHKKNFMKKSVKIKINLIKEF